MILTIPKSDRAFIEEACAELDLVVDFYTMENNEQMLKAEIVIDRVKNWDLTLSLAYTFGRLVQIKHEKEVMKNI